jgi:hypothetical protein
MASREYIGSGGMRLSLDEPLSPEMAKQVKRGHLVPADGVLPEVAQADDKSLVVSHGSEANTATRVGTHVRAPGEKPGDGASAGEWATYAVALGMEATQASTLSLTQLQEWVAAREGAEDSAESGGDVERPAKSAPVAEWRAYAAFLGMSEDDAAAATKSDCQDYVQVVEDTKGAGE